MTLTQTIPADTVLEKQLLGIALCGGPTALLDMERIIKPGDFFTAENGQLYGVMLDMLHDGCPVELASLAAELRKRGIMASVGHEKTDAGGADYLVELTEYDFATPNLGYYANQLRDQSRLRALITLGNRMSADAKTAGAEAGELIEQYQRDLYELGREDAKGVEVVEAGEAAAEAVARADRVAAGEESPGLMTGFAGIDRALGGFQPGDLVTLGAATSVGKTALALTVAFRVAQRGGAVLVVSAEMNRQSIANRLLQMVSGVSGGRLRVGNLDEQELEDRRVAQRTIEGWRLAILDQAATVAGIGLRARLQATRWRQDLSLIVVDYLQLMRPTGGDTRAQEVSGIAWGLKQLAMELGCPILMLSQLNRAGVRQAGDNRPPSLHDLKESGDVENHSNAVLLLHRPTNPVPDTAGAMPIWCKVAKARDGMVTLWPAPAGSEAVPGAVTLRFRPELTRFE